MKKNTSETIHLSKDNKLQIIKMVNKSNLIIFTFFIIIIWLFVTTYYLIKLNTDNKPIALYEPENDFSKNIITAKVPLFGTANNKVVIVTYTDTECPFCKLLHENVISKIKDEYKNITVYYNYLQFHNKSLEESEAVYCVNKYYPEKYYLYVDKLFRSTSGNDSLEYNTLLTMATSLDIDANKIDTCIKNDEVKTHTDNDAQDGIDKEIRGTPFTYILIRNGENYNVFAKISGARDYDYFNKILNKAISL